MISTEVISYEDSQNAYEGFIAYNTEIKAKAPIILIAHAFGGQSKFEERKAIELAQLGYIGFAIDIYGKGKRARDSEEAQELMDSLNSDRKLLLERMKVSLECAKKIKLADIHRIGAIGFCFGGKCVLDLARSGEKLNGIVSFHGLYDTPAFNQDTKITTPVLVLHGWDDPLASPNETIALANELTSKDANWEINAYGKTGHAFTNPNAKFPDKGLMYSKSANDRAWKRMMTFFEDAFK
ncbi:dienelactone hydrolase family protein [Reichenbachiella versicolor]|uniref:dienelactone hydrolase family protein n=1 Tax=Reichenbachiella versicolor TaxID=1821036 RepID=UPI000D6E00AD|nr:dienelactone hydrolase family protein [Reichenbachiella versicolor]